MRRKIKLRPDSTETLLKWFLIGVIGVCIWFIFFGRKLLEVSP